MQDIIAGLRAKEAGASFDNFHGDGAIVAGASFAKTHQVREGKSIFVSFVVISGSLVSSEFEMTFDKMPILKSTQIAPIDLDGVRLFVNRWVDREIKVTATNADASDRVLSYTIPYMEIEVRQKDQVLKAIEVI